MDRPDASREIDHQQRLQALRRLQRGLDSAFRIPGTSVRFGWDPIIGLVPWAGDFLTALMSIGIVMSAHQMGVPRVVQLRMLLTIAIDVLAGIIPIVGDAADVLWKANARNLAMLERYAVPGARPSQADWVFVTLVVAALIAIAALPVLMLYWAMTTLHLRLF